VGSSAWTPVDESAAQWTPVQEAKSPGATSRFVTSGREALGIPANPLQDISQGLQFSASHPAEAAKQIALSPIEGYKAAVNQQYERAHDAYQRGDYGQALLHGLYYLLTPIGGANLGKASEQAVQGDIAGSLGTTAGTALPLAAASPQVRANVAVPVNAARTATATALEKIDPTIAKAAGVAAGYKVAGWPGGVVGGIAAPAVISKAADFIRPGETIQPLPVSHALIQDAIKFLNSPGVEGEAAAEAPKAAPASTWPPAAPRNVIQPQPPKASAAELADRLETKSMQEAMQADLEKHGQSALSQERRDWFAKNVPGTPKGDLVAQANQAVYEKAARNGLPANASHLDITKAAAALKFQDEHLAEILQKSIQQIQAKRAQ
jgi:hypothetical protein